eukprot:CCRYP_015820-RA/>CCRYP_015820-RA protein AED:0.38 eAED:0.38 QI:0/0/0/1/0/0/3/0/267
MMKLNEPLVTERSLTHALSSTTGLKRTTPTAAISSITPENSQLEQLTLQQPKFCGIQQLVLPVPNLHGQTLKTCTYNHPWTDTNTCVYAPTSSRMHPKTLTTSGTKYTIDMEIQGGCYSLPQAGILANKLLKKQLATDGYFKLPHTPGLFKHISHPIQFALVVDDFGIKYIGKQHLDHLFASIKRNYDVTVDYKGSLYCGITLNWHYDKGYLDISMPEYVNKQLIKYNHPRPKKTVNTPWEPHPIKYGNPIQPTLPHDDSPHRANNR